MNLEREVAVARECTLRALDGQVVLVEGPANLQRGWEAVGGWLALSPGWLVFTAHRINWQADPERIPVNTIRRARPCWTRLLGLIPVCPNSFAVEAAGGVYRFAVRGRRRWVSALRGLLA
jgi:hypothetical protein